MPRQLTYVGLAGLLVGVFLLCGTLGALGWYVLMKTWGKPVDFVSAAVVNNPVSDRAMYSVVSVKHHICEVAMVHRWIVDASGTHHAVAKFRGSDELPKGRSAATFPVQIPESVPNLKGLFFTEMDYHCLWGSYAVILPPVAIEIVR